MLRAAVKSIQLPLHDYESTSTDIGCYYVIRKALQPPLAAIPQIGKNGLHKKVDWAIKNPSEPFEEPATFLEVLVDGQRISDNPILHVPIQSDRNYQKLVFDFHNRAIIW